MQIHNLTREQVEMLDRLWEFDTLAEIEQFKQGLPLFRRQQIETLLELLRLQDADDTLDETDSGVYPIAINLLNKLQQNS